MVHLYLYVFIYLYRYVGIHCMLIEQWKERSERSVKIPQESLHHLRCSLWLAFENAKSMFETTETRLRPRRRRWMRMVAVWSIEVCVNWTGIDWEVPAMLLSLESCSLSVVYKNRPCISVITLLNCSRSCSYFKYKY